MSAGVPAAIEQATLGAWDLIDRIAAAFGLEGSLYLRSFTVPVVSLDRI